MLHTNGTQNVAGTNVNGAGQSGAAITVVGLGGTITRGTVVTFPGCFAVNPQTRKTTGSLAQFVVTSDLAAGATSIPDQSCHRPDRGFPKRERRSYYRQPVPDPGRRQHGVCDQHRISQGRFHPCDGTAWTPPSKNVVSVSQKTPTDSPSACLNSLAAERQVGDASRCVVPDGQRLSRADPSDLRLRGRRSCYSLQGYQGYAAGATIIIPGRHQTALIAQFISFCPSGQPPGTYQATGSWF